MGYDHVRPERRQLCCVPANFIGFGRGPARVDLHVAADAPAGLLETLQERAEAGLKFPIVRSRGQENANEGRLLALLRARRERPRGSRAAEQRDELATFHRCNHSITSSARASKVGGTSMPSALAVLRLIASSKLVGACTGRASGRVPLRIRSIYSAARGNVSPKSTP